MLQLAQHLSLYNAYKLKEGCRPIVGRPIADRHGLLPIVVDTFSV